MSLESNRVVPKISFVPSFKKRAPAMLLLCFRSHSLTLSLSPLHSQYPVSSESLSLWTSLHIVLSQYFPLSYVSFSSCWPTIHSLSLFLLLTHYLLFTLSLLLSLFHGHNLSIAHTFSLALTLGFSRFNIHSFKQRFSRWLVIPLNVNIILIL